jgi:uncharacterized protein HemX
MTEQAPRDDVESSTDAAASAVQTPDSGEPQAVELDRPDSAAPARISSGVSALSLIAAALAFVAIAGTGFLWWQYRQFYVALADTDGKTATDLQQIRASQRSAEDEFAGFADTLSAYARQLRDVDARLDDVPGRLAEMQQRIDAAQGGSFDVRATWLQAEAQYYLSLANAELVLARNWDTASAALELADDRLREIADPSLAGIRELIADELLALASVRLVDVEGLSYGLARLGERVATLPLRSGSTHALGEDTADAEEEPGLGRLWSSVKRAFGGIIRVERRDEPVVSALTADEQRLLRRQLGVELQIARLALLRAEAETFKASLLAARALLQADFATQDQAVVGALNLIDELLSVDIAPAVPDISRSLSALRARGAG